MEDPSSGLTYSALTWVRKQSVEDVEHLFGPGVASFMEKHGYKAEAELVRTIRNWRRAIDERGLSEEQRRQFRDDFVNYILDEWMPWHKEGYDFSMLEVNRSYCICIVWPILISFFKQECVWDQGAYAGVSDCTYSKH